MTKFAVRCRQIVYYEMLVEADEQGEANRKVRAMLDGDEEPDLYEVDNGPMEIVADVEED